MSKKNTVVMTVYDRPLPIIINTLVALGKTGVHTKDTEFLIVDDGSKADYKMIFDQFREEGMDIRVVRVDQMEGAYSLDGYNNPSRASNLALDEIDSENVFWMSSDIMVQPQTFNEALKLDLGKVVWMPCVTDLDSGQEYLGPTRLTPFGWFFATKADTLRAVRWDEEYMKGLAFEDNDFMARLGLHVKRFVIDQRVRVWHQSHAQTAYSDELKGWHINKKYTVKKWGGVPWSADEKSPLAVSITTVNSQIVLDISQLKLVAS